MRQSGFDKSSPDPGSGHCRRGLSAHLAVASEQSWWSHLTLLHTGRRPLARPTADGRQWMATGPSQAQRARIRSRRYDGCQLRPRPGGQGLVAWRVRPRPIQIVPGSCEVPPASLSSFAGPS